MASSKSKAFLFTEVKAVTTSPSLTYQGFGINSSCICLHLTLLSIAVPCIAKYTKYILKEQLCLLSPQRNKRPFINTIKVKQSLYTMPIVCATAIRRAASEVKDFQTSRWDTI